MSGDEICLLTARTPEFVGGDDSETTIFDRTSVSNGAPSNNAEYEANISATFGSNTGTVNGIYYLNVARWNYG